MIRYVGSSRLVRFSCAVLCSALLGWGMLNILSCQTQPNPNGEPAATAPADKPGVIQLPGIETKELTKREQKQWSSYVTELLAPCPDQPVSIAQCVTEKRDCDSCLPSAKFLAKQVTAGKSRSQAESAFRMRFSPDTQKELELGDSPVKGAPDAAVTIVEWADFECPFCGMATPIVGKLVKQFPGKVRVIFKHFPLPGHEHSESAARAATAAGMQGKFWEMHDLLFKNQQGMNEKAIEEHAKSLGLDMKKFNEDWRSEKVADLVAADRKQAEKLSLKGTPSIFINGRLFNLELFDLAEDLEPWVQQEIELRLGKNAASAPAKPEEAPAAPTKAPDAPAKATGG